MELLLGVTVIRNLPLNMNFRQQEAGGQLRPHVYPRYPIWSERFDPDGSIDIIRHELVYLQAFKDLTDEEGISEEV